VPSEKRRGRPPKITTEKIAPKEPVLEAETPKAVAPTKEEIHQRQMGLAEMLTRLETQVQHAKLGGFQWLEVDRDVLIYMNKGSEPKPGYVIYKDIRLCLEGGADEIMKREGLDMHSLIFKNENMTVSTVRK
jgi:hypothetical protein